MALAVSLLLVAASPAGATTFATHVITAAADGSSSVYAVDLDGDSDMDVLSTSGNDDMVAWYENDGSENFTAHTITTTADGARSVFAVDLDGDLDIDVLSASFNDNTIAWYENDGSENFTAHTITAAALGARSVYALDVDDDSDIDVLSASFNDNTIAWYENDGSENFTARTITTAATGAYSVYAVDIDGDLDLDVLSASFGDNKIDWYENDGSENFTAHTITTAAVGAASVYAVDVNGDSEIDVLSASVGDNKVAWYENDGSENFTAHTITSAAEGSNSVRAVDLDGDLDMDVLSTSTYDHTVAWYENDGSENFTAHIITSVAAGAQSVHAEDVDGDANVDVLSASFSDDKVVWYENDDANPITLALHPTGDGATSEFTNAGCAGAWDCVNDQTGNGGSGPPEPYDPGNYLDGSTGQRVMFSLDDGTVPAGATITAINIRALVYRGSGPGANLRLSYQRMPGASTPDATPIDGPGVDLTTSCCTEISTTWSPGNWTTDDLDNLEIGAIHNTGSSSSYITQMYVFVSYVPGGGSYEISGTVFEDVNYGGGPGRDYATSLAQAGPFTIERDNVTVELYDAVGAFQSSATTALDGSYSFTNLAPALYTVRVVNNTITSTRAGSNGTEILLQTFRSDGDGEGLGTGANKVGGELPSDEDADANSGAQTLASLQGTDVDLDGVMEWTQSIVTVDASGGDVTGVDFGFNVDTIVNTNDSEQGSLRQFILNANLLTDQASVNQENLPAGRESSIFMIPTSTDPFGRPVDPRFDAGRGVAVITPGAELEAIVDSGTILDGTTQTVNVGDTNPGSLGYVGPVGLGADGVVATGDEATLSGVAAPEIELQGNSTIEFGLRLQGNDITLRGMAVYGFGISGLDANILVGHHSLVTDNTNCRIEANVLGTRADSFVDPGPGVRSPAINIYVRTADQGAIVGNLLGYVGRENVRLLSTALNWQVTDNEMRAGGRETTFGGVTYIADATGELKRNLIAEDNAAAVLGINTDLVIEDNTITGNLDGAIAFWDNSGSMVTTASVSLNDISGNGSGVVVFGENGASPAITGIRISRNRFSGNAWNAIDLAPSWTPDGISVNDGTQLGDSSVPNSCGTVLTTGNIGLDTPLIDSAIITAGTTTISGRACSGVEVEVYRAVADGDASDSVGGTDYGEGVEYLDTATADGTGDWTIVTTNLAVGNHVSAIAIDASGNTSEFGPNLVVSEFVLSGIVFEDADFAGTATDYDGGVADLPLVNVDVELYNGTTDAYLASTTTTAGGIYGFGALADGTYKIRVRSATIGDADTPPAGGLNATVPGTWPYPVAEMTWGNSAPLYGGQDATVDDTDTGDNNGPGDNYVTVSVSGADVIGVNLGFAYNLIVNTQDDGLADNARSDQGSLRQFLKNANAIGTANGTMANTSQFRIPTSDPGYNGSGHGEYSIQIVAILPSIVEQTDVDGATQPGYASNSNSAPLALNGIQVIEINGASLPSGTDGLTVGTAADGTVIRGMVLNRFDGTTPSPASCVVINAGATGVTLAGLYLGTDVTGLSVPGSNFRGILLNGSSCTVGGTVSADRNLVSGNAYAGMLIQGDANVVEGNLFGTDATGMARLSSGAYSFSINFADGTQVGGSAPGAANVIADRLLAITGASTGTRIQGNLIGVGSDGSTILGGSSGVSIDNSASSNLIGGTLPGEGNTIAGSQTRDGISITSSGTGNACIGNAIYGNFDLGIDLGDDGVTPNDADDGDTGANDLLNFPVITAATEVAGTVTVDFDLDLGASLAGDYRIEFFNNPSGVDATHGEGEIFTSDTSITHGGSGVESFSHSFAGLVGESLTATTTEDLGGGSYGSTSEFSAWFVITSPANYTISGLVFEDEDFAGAASAYDGGVSDLALANVDVELYDGADAYITSTTTAGDGSYSFTGLADGNYKVRVRSATIGDADTPPAGGFNATVPGTWPYPLPEMSWGNGSALIGGQDSDVDDSATGDNAGPGDTYVTITISGGDVTGVNFGFNYELIVNEDDDANPDNVRSKQGTLRQFIKNSNAISGVNKSWFQIPGL